MSNKGEEGTNAAPEQFGTTAAVLAVKIKSFSELIKEIESKEIFSYVNQILGQLIPIVSEHNGVIDKFTGAGLSAYYLKEPEKALRTAIRICETMRGKEDCRIGLCYGNIMIGMVGSKDCISSVTVSEHTGISEFLQKVAAKYYAHILITSSYARQIENFSDKYSCRFLGYIRILNMVEKIYDVFSGDKPEDIWMKKKTRLIFEEGVRLYTNKKPETARMNFIEVLKTSREDAAAREYLYLCDHYRKEENRGLHEIYIEEY